MELNQLLYCVVGTVALGGCAPKSDNPLLDANEQQFKMVAGAYFDCKTGLEKAAKTFSNATEVKGEAESDERMCLEKAQKLAANIGITDSVSFVHIQDPRVKERYAALRVEVVK
jgi:hypothetical protein